jgi:hypothetical protein
VLRYGLVPSTGRVGYHGSPSVGLGKYHSFHIAIPTRLFLRDYGVLDSSKLPFDLLHGAKARSDARPLEQALALTLTIKRIVND